MIILLVLRNTGAAMSAKADADSQSWDKKLSKRKFKLHKFGTERVTRTETAGIEL